MDDSQLPSRVEDYSQNGPASPVARVRGLVDPVSSVDGGVRGTPTASGLKSPAVSWGVELNFHGEVDVGNVIAEAMKEDGVSGGARFALGVDHVESGSACEATPGTIPGVSFSDGIGDVGGVEEGSEESMVRIIAEAMSEEKWHGRDQESVGWGIQYPDQANADTYTNGVRHLGDKKNECTPSDSPIDDSSPTTQLRPVNSVVDDYLGNGEVGTGVMNGSLGDIPKEVANGGDRSVVELSSIQERGSQYPSITPLGPGDTPTSCSLPSVPLPLSIGPFPGKGKAEKYSELPPHDKSMPPSVIETRQFSAEGQGGEREGEKDLHNSIGMLLDSVRTEEDRLEVEQRLQVDAELLRNISNWPLHGQDEVIGCGQLESSGGIGLDVRSLGARKSCGLEGTESNSTAVWQGNEGSGNVQLDEEIEGLMDGSVLHDHGRGGLPSPPSTFPCTTGGSSGNNRQASTSCQHENMWDPLCKSNNVYGEYSDGDCLGQLQSVASPSHRGDRGLEEMFSNVGTQPSVSTELLGHFIRAEGGNAQRAANLYLLVVEDFWQLRNGIRCKVE
ncbi:unnamed protein product [Choristocarpus tenellus]